MRFVLTQSSPGNLPKLKGSRVLQFCDAQQCSGAETNSFEPCVQRSQWDRTLLLLLDRPATSLPLLCRGLRLAILRCLGDTGRDLSFQLSESSSPMILFGPLGRVRRVRSTSEH